MLAMSPTGSLVTSSAPTAAAVALATAANTNLRRGLWMVDEDSLLVIYIATHSKGRWNSIACSAGLNPEAHGQELPPLVAQLPMPRRAMGQHHRGGVAADPRPALVLGQPLVQDRSALLGPHR